MNNVNTKLKDFYDHGYNDAIDQCSSFLLAVESKFGKVTMTDGLNLGNYIAVINKEIKGFKNQKQDQDHNNVR